MSSFWSFVEQAQAQAKELASQAQVQAQAIAIQAQETATTLTKKATETYEAYDHEKAASFMMDGIGASHSLPPPDKSVAPKVKKSQRKANLAVDMTYITENVLSMGFPYDYSDHKNTGQVGNDIDVVSEFLQKKCKGHFMIWNVSEESYDYTKFENQVLEYKFPGHPAPPLGLMFKICTSVESWLDADVKNIALVHCLTGKGRTAVIVSAILTWIGEFSSPLEALQYISDRKNIPIDILTIPSQRRYVQYFTNVLDGVKPKMEPLLLKRIIMNNIPYFGENDGQAGCCPYIQIFKNGRLIGTTSRAAGAENDRAHSQQQHHTPAVMSSTDAKWGFCAEGNVQFYLDCVVQGDILLRCRHLDTENKARVSMFRAAFHTGYVHSGVLRLTKAQLDGPNTDTRFHDEFYIDLIFSAVDMSSNNLNAGLESNNVNGDGNTSEAFEQMLHKDIRFWESVNSRKARAKKRSPRKFASNTSEKFSIFDHFGDVNDSDDVARGATYTEEEDDHESQSADTKTNSTNDLDLIALLALAEADDKSVAVQHNAFKSVGDASFLSDSPPQAKLSSVVTDDDESQLQVGEGSSTSTTTNVSDRERSNNCTYASSHSSGHSVATAKNELQALEDLEKELGLDITSMISSSSRQEEGGTSTKSLNKSVTVQNTKDDDLDDLENFLKSLGK